MTTRVMMRAKMMVTKEMARVMTRKKMTKTMRTQTTKMSQMTMKTMTKMKTRERSLVLLRLNSMQQPCGD